MAESEALLVFLVQAAGSLLLALCLYAFFRAYQRDYLRLWTLSWLALCVALLATALSHQLILTGGPQAARRMASLVLAVGSYWQALWLLLGIWELRGERALSLRRELYALAAVGLFGAATVLGTELAPLEVRFFVRSDLRAAILGAAHLVAAIGIATAAECRTAIGRRVVVAALTVYGLLQLRHPLLPLEVPGGVALDFLDLFALFAVAVGMVTTLLELERARVARAAAQNRQLRTLLEAMPDLVTTARETGTLVYLNSAGRSLLGVGADEPLDGLVIYDFLESESAARLRGEGLSTALRQGSWQGETVFRSRSGDRIPTFHELVAHPDDGSARVISSVAQDVRERRALEDRLREAQRLEAIAMLAGGVAHDFSNVLTVIGGYADLIQHLPTTDAATRSSAREIWRAHERGTSLTRQLLAFARRQELRATPLLLSEVIDELQRFLGRLVGSRHTIVTAAPKREQPVLADRTQLEQVVTNLVINAKDAMPDGGRIEIDWEPVELDEPTVLGDTSIPAGQYMAVRVRDHGRGMDRDTRLRIFEPFFTTKAAGGGTGLGLSTVYGIVEQSGGKVAVESEPGQGSTFHVLLPKAERRTEDIATVATAERDVHGRETVLVAESDEAVCQLVTDGLEGRGYRVRAASTLEEALRMLEELGAELDLLVTDVAIRGSAGEDLAARCRERLPSLRVLYIAAGGEVPSLGSGTGAPVLQSPFGVHDLAIKVREVLERGAA